MAIIDHAVRCRMPMWAVGGEECMTAVVEVARARGYRGSTEQMARSIRRPVVETVRLLRELEDTYFRWLTRTDDQLRESFDRYDAREAAASG
jgi:hypothetical protein